MKNPIEDYADRQRWNEEDEDRSRASPSSACSASLRKPTYDELYDYAKEVWQTCGASDPLNEDYFNERGNRLFLPRTTPIKKA